MLVVCAPVVFSSVRVDDDDDARPAPLDALKNQVRATMPATAAGFHFFASNCVNTHRERARGVDLDGF